ncbi:MAG: MobF family relaxase [Blastococcus sp.]
MSLHKLSAGSGYTYLTRQVAAGDVTARGRGSLGGYYEQRGETPGVWLGAGLASLNGGPLTGDPVSEAQMLALFGRGAHPNPPTTESAIDGQPAGSSGSVRLGAPFVTTGPRVSVAGYDLTFSPVKSVSALWALADPPTAAQVEAAHTAAVADTIGWLERTAVYTRLGAGGIRQVDVTGLLAVAFTHRDSRAADPDLHTHVAISNKVQTLDGRWRALDGRALHAAAVAASERYNTRLEAQLVDRLGVSFRDRTMRPGARPVRELAGIPEQLLKAWSSRRTRIVDRSAELTARFRDSYGRDPTVAEGLALAQQATLATRPAKHGPRSLAEQRDTWRAQAEQLLGPGVGERLVERVLSRRRPAPVDPVRWAVGAAVAAVRSVSAERAVFGSHHVRAELERLARTDRLPLHVLDAAVEQALTHALSKQVAVRIGGDAPVATDAAVVEPEALRRRDGGGVYASAHSQRYTTREVLAAEHSILTTAAQTGGRRVPAGLVELALLEARLAGRPLNVGQQGMVTALACSGRRVQVALAPAGTGKTTALGVLAQAWTDAGGSVLGAAPSAVSASELREAIGQPAVTLATAVRHLQHGWDVDGLPVGPALLLLVDEAGMAATADLAELVHTVTDAGGSVRLVGDTAQLSSPAAGGILRDLVGTHGAVELDTPVRFTNPAEAAATLAIRTGDPAGLDFYNERGRIHTATPTLGSDAHDRTDTGDGGNDATAGDALDSALTAWAADRAAGRASLLLAGSNAVVTELNARARATRQTLAGATDGPEVALRDGTAASIGDVVLARHNNRDLQITSRESVKNGDRFTITGLTGDGGLRVRHTATRRSLTLPAAYVAEHVQLGYAATIHLAQGTTVDTTHTVLTGRESREQLYVALTRGRQANHLHLAGTPADLEDPAHPVLRPASDSNDPDPQQLLTDVLGRSDQRPSATSTLLEDADPGRRLQAAIDRYLDAHTLAAGTPLPPGTRDTGGPLPWLPPPPDPDRADPRDAELAEYLQQRADLINALGATITADHLPDTDWVAALRAADPDLARRLAVWRAATGAADHPHPLGPASTSTPEFRARLHAELQPHLPAGQLSHHDRWDDHEAATGPVPEHERLAAHRHRQPTARGIRR